MGRKAKGRKASQGFEDDEFEGSESGASSSTQKHSLGDVDLYEETDSLSMHLDDLLEKRSSTREQALSALMSALRTRVCSEECEQNFETLTARCLLGLKRTSSAECEYSSVVLGLHAITLGERSDKLYKDIQQPLFQAAAAAGKSDQARAAAVTSLAVACFVLNEDIYISLLLLDKLRSLWQQGSSKVVAAAVSSWGFVLASIDQHALPQASVDAAARGLAPLLSSADVDVRAAAGTAAALLYHKCADAHDLDIYDDSDGGEYNGNGYPGCTEDDDDDEEEEGVGNRTGSPTGGADLGAVVKQMQVLASNVGDGVRRSRKAKASTKRTFRELCKSVERGSVASVKVKLAYGDEVVVSEFVEVLVLNFLRKFLGGGFQAHMQGNPLLHSVFNFQPRQGAPERMSGLEKRLFKSPSSAASKNRTQARAASRSMKADAMAQW